jgi:hypothetical protein
VPLQSTLQGPAPQLTFWQLCALVQLIVHEVLPRQLMPLRHGSGPNAVLLHSTLQLQPVGHVTCCLQPPLSEQSIVQLLWPITHDVHCEGQTAASPNTSPSRTPASPATSTQKPSTQVRSEAHLCSASHTKSSLRWFTEQLPAATIASPRATRQSAASFTAVLRS